MSKQTLPPTATKPFTEAIRNESMSPIATEADLKHAVENIVVPQTVADSTATTVAGLKDDFNGLLAALRTAGVLNA